MSRIDRKAIVIAIVVPIVLWLLCWPFADMAVNDDFAFAFAVRRLMETGRLTFNGWGCPTLGPQALFAAGVASIVGSSHDAMRLSVLPFSVACAALSYALHRRFAIDVRWSLFATLALVASPLYTPWAASFMTDVPGLAFWLATLHAIVSLRRARDARGVARASAAVLIVGVLGGSVRQSTYVLAAAALAVEWIVRRRAREPGRGFIAVALALLLAAAGAISYWASRQTYFVAEGPPDWRRLPAGVVDLGRLGLDFATYLLPLVVALLPLLGLRRRTIAACVAVAACVVVPMSLSHSTHLAGISRAPFLGGTLSATGLTVSGLDAPGARPIVLPLALRAAIAVAAYSAAFTVAIAAWRRRREWRCSPEQRVLLILAIVYVALIYPRATHSWAFDRYVLVLFPLASIVALVSLRPTVAPRPAAWAVLAVFALFGAAVTNDHFREMRVRASIADDLLRGGVPRTDIANGLAFDAWTELLASNHLNDFRLGAAGGYREDANDRARQAVFWFLPRTPVVTPRWIVANALKPSGDGAVVRTVAYRAILPPGTRWIEVRHVPDAPATLGVPADSARPAKVGVE